MDLQMLAQVLGGAVAGGIPILIVAMGLVASGIYDLIDGRWPKATEPEG